MRSRLDGHVDFILSELQTGNSYESTAKKLTAMGCKTSRVNLYLWLKRRAARIQAKLHLTDPLGAIQTSRQQVPTAPVHEPAEKETVADVAASAPADEEVGFISHVFRRGSVVKPPLSPVQQQMRELARQAGLPAALVWKIKKNV